VGASGYNYNVLPKFINEPYNHAGLALNPKEIHHVESHGYETVSVESFFSGDNAAEGAIIRFIGPHSALIRERTARIARERTYKKIPGNPFSTSDDLSTVNCNEFIHELYRKAIAELLAETRTQKTRVFAELTRAYTSPAAADQVANLIKARDVEFTMYDLYAAPAVAKAAEVVGKTQVNNPDVKVQFEGRIERRYLGPPENATSWNPLVSEHYWDSAYTVAVLHTYTPNSFINSPFFSLVSKVTKGQ
jgi:hypothetical protein